MCATVSGSFLNQVVVFLLLSFKSSSYILGNSPLTDVSFLNIFLPSYGLSFHSLDRVAHRAEHFNCNDIQFINSVMNHGFSGVSKKPGANPSSRLLSTGSVSLTGTGQFTLLPRAQISAHGLSVNRPTPSGLSSGWAQSCSQYSLIILLMSQDQNCCPLPLLITVLCPLSFLPAMPG